MKTLNGSERVVLELTRELANRGYETQILSLRIAEECRRQIGQSVRVTESGIPLRKDGYLASLLQYVMLPLLLVRAEKPDVIISHAYASLPASVAYARITGVPNIYLCHEPPRFAYDLYELHEKRLGKQGRLLRVASAAMKRFDRWLVGKADRVVVLSGFMEEAVKKIYGIDAEVIPGGVDVGSFTDRFSASREGGGKSILSVGKLHPRKNFEIQLRVLREITGDNDDVRLVIVGQGPQRGELEELAGALSISRYVHFAGFVEEVELPAYYLNADLFLFTALREPFGLVVLEAMCCGLPVIVPGEGGPSEIVVDGQSGYHYEQGNLDDLRMKIEHILEMDFEARNSLGKKARERALEYTWNRYADRIVEMLSDIRPVGK